MDLVLISLTHQRIESNTSSSEQQAHFLFEAFGQLVPLGFDIAAFTPVAYLRHRL
jgi:hypothetical protein